MSQITIYLRDALERRVAAAAKRDGKSRSLWVAEAVHARLEAHDGFPPSFFETFGSWEDDRSTEKIVAEIKRDAPGRRRAAIK